MLSLIKWLFALILTLALLLALAFFVVPRVIDPNDYKDELVALVKDRTDRDLQLNGDLKISVFPWLGVKTQNLSLSQPPEIGDADGPMVKVATGQLRVKLLPLLSRRLEVDTVVFEQPELRLITLADGTSSFSGLSGSGDAPVLTESQQQAIDSSGAAVALVIQGLEINGGSATWDDRQSGQRYTLDQLNVETGNLIGTSPATMEISGFVKDNTSAPSIRVDAAAMALIDTEKLTISLSDIQADLGQDQQSLELEIEKLLIDENAEAHAQKISYEAVVPDAAGIKQLLKGTIEDLRMGADGDSVSMRGLQAELKSSDDLSIVSSSPELKFNFSSQRLGASNVSVQTEIDGREFDLSLPDFTLDLIKQTASSRQVQILSNDISAKLQQLRVSEIFDAPKIRGQLSVQPFNAVELLKEFDIDHTPADANAMKEIELTAGLTLAAEQVVLENLDLNIDQSKLQGRFSAQDFNNPELDFDLSLNSMNLDHYLPPDENGEGQGSGATALVAPMALFKGLNANGRFRAKTLISGGIEVNDINVQISSTPGNVTITPKANLYEGTMGGAMVYSEEGTRSVLRVDNQVSLINLSKFLQAADVNDQLSGTGSLKLDLTITEENGVQSNSGTIQVLAKKGAVQGVDVEAIFEQVMQSYASIQSLRGRETDALFGESDAENATRFDELTGTFNIEGFKLVNQDLNISTPLFEISGRGNIDLQSQTLQYQTDVTVLKSAESEETLFSKLQGLTIPVRYSGALTAPEYHVSTSKLLKFLAKNEVKEELSKELGVEADRPLSTREIIEQAILNKINEKVRKDEPQEPVTIEAPNTRAQQPSETNNDEAEERNSQELESGPAPDVYADPNYERNQTTEDTATGPENNNPEEEQSAEDKLKEKLLEGLFN